jgi:hypothetical protein
MSVENVHTKYFKVVVSWPEPKDAGGFIVNRVLFLPLVCYSTQEKLQNYLKKAGILLLSCKEIIS